jgi:hypothetical protein
MNKFKLSRETLTSRSFWTGLIAVTTGVLTAMGQLETNLAAGILSSLAGLGTIFIRDAIASGAAAGTDNSIAAPTAPEAQA